jgi:ferredoxin
MDNECYLHKAKYVMLETRLLNTGLAKKVWSCSTMNTNELCGNNCNLFVGGFKDLGTVVKLLQEDLGGVRLFGYKLHNDRIEFGEMKDFDEIPTTVADIQKPGYFRISSTGYRFRHSFSSPKAFLLPPEHSILTVSQGYEIVEDGDGEMGVVFLGIKPCDRKAMSILDGILYGKSPVYTKRRDSIKAIIVEECLEPGETCFCSAVKAGPTISSGFDIAYARLYKDTLVFKYGSSLGEKILVKAGLQKAQDSHVKAYFEMVANAISMMNSRISRVEELQKALKERIGDKSFWEKVSSNCVGCGNCNYVCPTCFCTEINDIVEEGYSKRIGMWLGCLTYTYGLVAGGHFRQELYTRYRHFVLHKFLFYPKQVGDVGCVGCGRCITWCPLGVDLRDTLNLLVEGGTR